MINSTFPKLLYWPRTSYILKSHKGFDIITLDPDSFSSDPYYPLEYEPNLAKPNNKIDQFSSSPTIALARLNVSKDNEILDFVNEWGLLGLWNIPRYTDDYGINDKLKLEQNQEPIIAFKRAVKEFQEFIDCIIISQSNTEIAQSKPLNMTTITSRSNDLLKDISPQFIWNSTKKQLDIQWLYTSLLSTIYLNTFLLIQSDGQFKKCIWHKCNLPFYCRRKGNKYCCSQCKSSQTSRDTQIKSWKSNLIKLFPNFESRSLENQIDKLLKDGYSGERTLEKELKKLIEGGFING